MRKEPTKKSGDPRMGTSRIGRSQPESSLLEEALRALLADATESERTHRADFTWPTFGGGATPAVDIDDNSTVLDAMDRG